MIVAGLHTPSMPLSDVDGRVGTTSPAQNDNELLNGNVGTVFGVTVTVNVTAPGVTH